MRIVCIGGGPAGLYFAILMKKADPAHRVTIFERNRPNDTFGWGVVFSDQTLENMRDGDTESQKRIIDTFAHWDDIEIHFKGQTTVSHGHGFCGIERKRLLNILQERARELGVELLYEHEVSTTAPFADADLIIAADGINSRIRGAYAEQFQPEIEWRRNKFVWLGTHRLFEAFTFIFVQTEWGWFQAHAYRFNADTSTFIVETREESWRAAGLDRADTAATLDFCRRLFAPWLEGEALMVQPRPMGGSDWITFPRVSNKSWVHGNLVLMGDAAHSAHFSIGSGTKLALEDAIALARAIQRHDALPAALAAYETERRVEVLRLQSAARNSTEWFENVARYARMPPRQFAYSLLTRSQRVSHENLRRRDKAYLERVERWLGERTTGKTPERPVPPMFLPFRLKSMTLANRVVVSPMAMYSAKDGVPNDFHLVHLGARALGGAGLVFTEMTCVTQDGRISPGCCGLWNDAQEEAYARIVRFVHERSQAKIALQLGHSGPKGATRVGWEGYDVPLDPGEAWPVMGPSPLPWSPANQVPREATRADMDAVRDAFVAATRRGARAGFDMLELHAAHGYLLSAFISPLSNERRDAYGGSLENRLRFPLEVFRAMRLAWPAEKPMSVRISACDWVEGGIAPSDAVEIAQALKRAGADLIDVSAGQTSIRARPIYGRMFQTPFSDRIRNEVGIATMAVGNIFDTDHINSIIAGGRADLCALARPHLADPHFMLHAAAALGFEAQPWPAQWLPGRDQLLRQAERAAADLAIAI
jgi:anthraniloyl-CoA monooxygenase